MVFYSLLLWLVSKLDAEEIKIEYFYWPCPSSEFEHILRFVMIQIMSGQQGRRGRVKDHIMYMLCIYNTESAHLCIFTCVYIKTIATTEDTEGMQYFVII